MTEKPKRRVRKAKETRYREIVEAAAKVISEHGIDGASVSRIATEAGLTPGALYRHFKSRREILVAALHLMEERASNWVARSWNPDVHRHLEDMATDHATWAEAEFETFVRPVIMFLADSHADELTQERTERQLAVFSTLLSRVEEGQRQGSIRPDVPAEDVAWTMLIFAWARDYGRLMGVSEFVDPSLIRNWKRLLTLFATGTD